MYKIILVMKSINFKFPDLFSLLKDCFVTRPSTVTQKNTMDNPIIFTSDPSIVFSLRNFRML